MKVALLLTDCTMTRGNQRDLAREKAAKKDKGKGKAAKDQEANQGMTKEARMQRLKISSK